MRIELSGSMIHPDPVVFRFASSDTFYPGVWVQEGYTHFEVICIGAGGGMGGGVNTGSGIRNYGGAGGGGGYHRVRGLLSALGTSASVVVGAGGVQGAESGDPAGTTDGGDGGYSSFNISTCMASGGKGGKRASSNTTAYAGSDGGDGGVGNRTNAGGGALGGTVGRNGADGTLINNVGKGGGGGAGGVGEYNVGTHVYATSGGRGSYNPGDTSVYGPGDAPDSQIIPGGASGAKATPLNGIPTVYGKSKGQPGPGEPGIVIVRLTAE